MGGRIEEGKRKGEKGKRSFAPRHKISAKSAKSTLLSLNVERP